MASNGATNRAVGKKFVIACDGTWMNSDMGNQLPTNVTRIIRALKHKDDNGVSQIAFYQRGVGTDNDTEDKIISGLTGGDLSEHVREAYSFVANNFDPETQIDLDDRTKPIDEIVLLGFSRGAYTARCISDLISTVGLLTKIGMESFWDIFEDWKNQDMPGKEGKWFETTFGKNIPFSDHAYVQTLIDNGLTRWGMPIRAVCVWDTVGALGIPFGSWDSAGVKPYSFVNQKVAKQVQHAFHALAIDERRGPFSPTLWEKPDQSSELRLLKQCWFPGVHSNIGGSYPDAGQSNITLAWMISQLEDTDGGILSFDATYLDWIQDQNAKYYATVNEPVRPWGLGKLYDSSQRTDLTTVMETLSLITRTPGRYCTINTKTGLPTKTQLTETNEYIHRCVRARIESHGLGSELEPDTSKVTYWLNLGKKLWDSHPSMQETITYESEVLKNALKNYELVHLENTKVVVGEEKNAFTEALWRARDGIVPSLPEDNLGRTELRLLKRSLQGIKN